MLDNYIKWLRAHHTVLLIVAVFGTLLFLGNKYLNHSYDVAVARSQAAQEVLKDQVAKNADLQKQQDTREQQYQAMLDTLTRQNQSLVSAVAARNSQVVGQQKVDAALSTTELSARHESLVGLRGVNYTENGYLVAPGVELQTVQSLETLPAFQANLKDEQTLVSNKDAQITGLNGVVVGLNGQVDGLRLQLTDSGKACDAEVSVARKSRWKWFKTGLVLGFGSGVVVGHKIP